VRCIPYRDNVSSGKEQYVYLASLRDAPVKARNTEAGLFTKPSIVVSDNPYHQNIDMYIVKMHALHFLLLQPLNKKSNKTLP